MQEADAMPMDNDLLMESPRLRGSSVPGERAISSSSITGNDMSRLDVYGQDLGNFQQTGMVSGLQQQLDSEAPIASASFHDLPTDTEGAEPSFRGLRSDFLSTSIMRQAFDLDYDSSLR
jgi:hypothetical protein